MRVRFCNFCDAEIPPTDSICDECARFYCEWCRDVDDTTRNRPELDEQSCDTCAARPESSSVGGAA